MAEEVFDFHLASSPYGPRVKPDYKAFFRLYG